MLKKIIAVLLSVLIFISAFSLTSFAENKDDIVCPTVYVHGFMSKEIYEDKDNADSKVVWPPSTDSILSCVKGAVPHLLGFVLTGDWDRLGQNIVPLTDAVIGMGILDKNGEPKGNTGVRFTYPEESTVKNNSVLSFSYDWRIDPIEVAGQLNDYINYVLECSGSSKVNLVAHSFGGVIITTYATLYGCDKIRSAVYNTTAVYGITYNGELMNGNLFFEDDSVIEFMKFAFAYNDNAPVFNLLFKALQLTGLAEGICNIANTVYMKMYKYVSADIVIPMFGRWLSIWAMIPDSKVDTAMKFVFDTVYGDCKDDYAELISKIDNYNKTVRPKVKSTLNEMNSKCNLYVLSRSGFSGLPLTPGWNVITDGNIDTQYSSFGATCSPYNSRLSDEYLKDKESKMISPDKKIDASTCQFPEQTWFINNYGHSRNDDCFEEFVEKLIAYNGQATVDTFKEYPRFLKYDSVNDIFVKDNGQTEDNVLKAFVDYINKKIK